MAKNSLESYQNHFKSPVGAYTYLLLNQYFPEIFVISSDKYYNCLLGEMLEKELKSAQSIKGILKAISDIDEEFYEDLSSIENEIDKNKIKNLVSQIEKLKLSSNNWEPVNSLIKFNDFGLFIDNKERIKKRLIQLKEKYHLKTFSLNPNYQCEDFLNKFEKDIQIMCQTLEIESKHIGLDVLELNYQTEEGNFNGYINYPLGLFSAVRAKMVIKNIEVFTHEWMHFIDSALGIKMESFTEVIETKSKEFKKSGLSKMLDFNKVINSKDNMYSEELFNHAFLALSRLLEKYALNKETYYKNLKKLGDEFLVQPNELGQKKLITSMKKLFSDNYPERYLSFIHAQCEIYQDKLNKKRLSKNHMISFSQKADKYLKEENYTASHIETFARTFESYLKTKLETNNMSSHLLAPNYTSDLYPQGNYKVKTDEYWNKAWKEIKIRIEKEMNKKYTRNNIICNINTMRNNMVNMGILKLKK